MVNAEVTQALTDIGGVVTGIMGMFTDVLGLFLSEPILILGLGIAVTAFVIGKAKGLI